MFVRLLATQRLPAVLAVVLMVSAPAAAEFQVQFVEPERYTDAHLNRYDGPDERVLRIVEQHLQRLASRCVDASDALHIQVLDIDLAGRQEWGRGSGAYNLRIMSEVTWPRIQVVYTLRRGMGEVIEVRQRISDMNYLWNSAYIRADSTPLPYERVMLTNWFERTFCR